MMLLQAVGHCGVICYRVSSFPSGLMWLVVLPVSCITYYMNTGIVKV